MGSFCGDMGAPLGKSFPKHRNGNVVENVLFPHLDSFTEDRPASPLNTPSELASTSSLWRSSTTVPLIVFLAFACSEWWSSAESNYARSCRSFRASSSPSHNVSYLCVCTRGLLSTLSRVRCERETFVATRYKRCHALPWPALLAYTRHQDQRHLVFCVHIDRC